MADPMAKIKVRCTKHLSNLTFDAPGDCDQTRAAAPSVPGIHHGDGSEMGVSRAPKAGHIARDGVVVTLADHRGQPSQILLERVFAGRVLRLTPDDVAAVRILPVEGATEVGRIGPIVNRHPNAPGVVRHREVTNVRQRTPDGTGSGAS